MHESLFDRLMKYVGKWLTKEKPGGKNYWSDFIKIRQEVRPADVILVHGHSRVSHIIQNITLSPWTHSALYIGSLHEISDLALREKIKQVYDCALDTQLIIESLLGEGTVVTPLDKYKDEHIRILRPQWLTEPDISQVITFAISHLGRAYNMRQVLDLARFMFPWHIFPRRWRSSLFEHNALQPTKDICSTVIAEAFQSVGYPILPLIQYQENKQPVYIHRNARLFTPSDFDFSPFFSIIKYPMLHGITTGNYSDIKWKRGVISQDEGRVIMVHPKPLKSVSPQIQRFLSSPAFAVIGASDNPKKYGNRVLKCYLSHNKTVYPVNPKAKEIEKIPCYDNVSQLPDSVKSISIVTPPRVTETIIDEIIAKGINNVWMQPGAESPLAIQKCEKHNINVIANGPCILVELGCV